MISFRIIAGCLAVAFVLQLQPAFAQSGGGGGGGGGGGFGGGSTGGLNMSSLSGLSGLTGLSGLGGGGIGTSTGMTGGASTSGRSTTGTSSTSMSSRSTGSTTSSFGGNSSSGSMSGTSSSSGQSGLSGTGTSGLNGGQSVNTQAQSFVGGSGAQSFVGGGMQGNANRSNRQFQAFQQQQGMTNQGMGTTGSPRQIKSALRVNFSGPAASDLQRSGRTAPANRASLDRFAAKNPQFAGLNVTLSPTGVAVLQGTVPSADAARLAANLLRLQPGVRSVDNQATIDQGAQQ